MKILLCPSAYAPHKGGVEELTFRLASEYQRQGHQVLVVTSRWPLNLPNQEVLQNIEVRRIDYVMPRRQLKGLVRFLFLFPLRLWALGRIIQKFQPSVVHIQCVSVQGFYLWLLKKLLGFRLVVTLQGEQRMDDHQIYQRSWLMRFMLARLLNSADYVTACSHAALTDGVEDLWQAGPNSQVIPNGISLSEFEKSESGFVNVPDRPYIFATGRHVHNKGFDILIEAFSKLASEQPSIGLVIGGDGAVHKALQSQIERLGLTKRVRLPGYLDRSQTIAYFKHCLFFILPSRYEPFGIVNLEAMAAGKAIIAFNTGGITDIIEEGKNGLLVPSEDSVAMSKAISFLLDAPEQAEMMGQNGYSRIAQNFNWPVLAAQYLEIYLSVKPKH